MSVEIGWLTAHDSDLSEYFQNVKIQPFTVLMRKTYCKNSWMAQFLGCWVLSTDQYLKVRRNSYTKHHRQQYLNIEIKGYFRKRNHTATTGMYYKYILYIYIRTYICHCSIFEKQTIRKPAQLHPTKKPAVTGSTSSQERAKDFGAMSVDSSSSCSSSSSENGKGKAEWCLGWWLMGT